MKSNRTRIIEACLGRWVTPAALSDAAGLERLTVLQSLCQMRNLHKDCIEMEYGPRKKVLRVKANFDPTCKTWPVVKVKKHNMGDALRMMRRV